MEAIDPVTLEAGFTPGDIDCGARGRCSSAIGEGQAVSYLYGVAVGERETGSDSGTTSARLCSYTLAAAGTCVCASAGFRTG